LWRYSIPLVYLAYGKKNFKKEMRAKGIDMGDVLACLDEDGDHIHEVAIEN
jgi:hypothetical protein